MARRPVVLSCMVVGMLLVVYTLFFQPSEAEETVVRVAVPPSPPTITVPQPPKRDNNNNNNNGEVVQLRDHVAQLEREVEQMKDVIREGAKQVEQISEAAQQQKDSGTGAVSEKLTARSVEKSVDVDLTEGCLGVTTDLFKGCSASSAYGPPYECQHAFKGSREGGLDMEWASRDESVGAWISVDLTQPHKITDLLLMDRSLEVTTEIELESWQKGESATGEGHRIKLTGSKALQWIELPSPLESVAGFKITIKEIDQPKGNSGFITIDARDCSPEGRAELKKRREEETERLLHVVPLTPDTADTPPAHSPCGGGNKVTMHSGFDMCVYPSANRDLVSDAIRGAHAWGHCDDLKNIYQRLGSDSSRLFLDVGANLGTCGFYMAALGAPVVMFEPVTSNARFIQYTMHLNKWKNSLQLYKAAVAEDSGIATIHVEQFNKGNSIVGDMKQHDLDFLRGPRSGVYTKERIPLLRIDSVVNEHVSLMKLDCQGHELNALKGASKLIDGPGIDFIKFEFSPPWMIRKGQHAIALLQFLWNHGYKIQMGHGSILEPKQWSNFIRGLGTAESSFVDLEAVKEGGPRSDPIPLEGYDGFMDPPPTTTAGARKLTYFRDEEDWRWYQNHLYWRASHSE